MQQKRKKVVEEINGIKQFFIAPFQYNVTEMNTLAKYKTVKDENYSWDILSMPKEPKKKKKEESKDKNEEILGKKDEKKESDIEKETKPTAIVEENIVETLKGIYGFFDKDESPKKDVK